MERLWRWSQRNPVLAGLTAAVFGLLAAVAGVASVGYVQTQLALNGEANLSTQVLQMRAANAMDRCIGSNLSGLADSQHCPLSPLSRSQL
jgi:hypothetical protein